MPRDLSIGNGNILIAFDKDGLLREFFFPYVGEENHTKGNRFRFGVWIDGQFSWIGEGWQIQRDYLDDALVSQVDYFHPHLALKIVANDLVDFHENLYLKKLSVENLSSQEREI